MCQEFMETITKSRIISFQYIDHSVAELPGLMVTMFINGDKNIITKNTIENVQASATVTPGEREVFSC